MPFSELFIKERSPQQGLLAVEWAVMAYAVFTLSMISALWPQMEQPRQLLWGRVWMVGATLVLWLVYRLWPCRAMLLGRITGQLVMLSWWYPDTYELNRLLPNLDPVFAALDQDLFGFQPALLFHQWAPWPWFSELMCLGYASYYPLLVVVTLFYFFLRPREFQMASFVILTSFFVYYVIFVLVPVTGPQYYYLAAGIDQIAQGVFPDVGTWFRTHTEALPIPGWADGVCYQLVESAHAAGERPTAAFPSSHVGVTTILMLLALHTRNGRFFMLLLPFYVLMCLATVYIQAHYAVDAIAGLVTGVIFYGVLRTVYAHLRA